MMGYTKEDEERIQRQEEEIRRQVERVVGIAKFFWHKLEAAHNRWPDLNTPECWNEIKPELQGYRAEYPKVPTDKIDRAVYLVLGWLILQARKRPGAFLDREGTPRGQVRNAPRPEDYFFPLDFGELCKELENESGSATFDWGMLKAIAMDLEQRVLPRLRQFIILVGHRQPLRPPVVMQRLPRRPRPRPGAIRSPSAGGGPACPSP